MRWPTIALLVLLPLQWFPFVTSPLGQTRLHQAAIFAFMLYVFARYSMRTYAPILRASAMFVIANLYLVGAVAAVSMYRGDGAGAAVQHLLYLLVFVAFAGFFYLVAAGREPRVLAILRSAAVLVCGSLLVGLAVAMLVNGVNPLAVLGQSIASGDPEVIEKQLYRSAFAGFGLDEDEFKGNLRHEIYGSVLLSMLISTWAMRIGPAPSPRQRAFYRGALMVGALLLALSFSRAVLVAAACWPLLLVWRSARRGELTPRQVAAVFVAAAAGAVLLVSGLGAVISNRFVADTDGYEARVGNYGVALREIPAHWLTGGFDTVGVSSHNFAVDTWLREGVFAFVPAAVIVATVLVVFVGLAWRVDQLPLHLVPVVTALALPLVRMGTSGGGSISPVQWLVLAFVAGALAAWRRDVGDDPVWTQPAASTGTAVPENVVSASRPRAMAGTSA